jgi:head-tail adaptor
MKPAGLRSHRVEFQRQFVNEANEAGNVLKEWRTIDYTWAHFRQDASLANQEPLKAGRLQSSFSGLLNVHRNASTSQVTAADRVRFLYAPFDTLGFCQIQAVKPTPDSREIEFVIETGLPT